LFCSWRILLRRWWPNQPTEGNRPANHVWYLDTYHANHLILLSAQRYPVFADA
jgi:hypothetical protein